MKITAKYFVKVLVLIAAMLIAYVSFGQEPTIIRNMDKDLNILTYSIEIEKKCDVKKFVLEASKRPMFNEFEEKTEGVYYFEIDFQIKYLTYEDVYIYGYIIINDNSTKVNAHLFKDKGQNINHFYKYKTELIEQAINMFIIDNLK